MKYKSNSGHLYHLHVIREIRNIFYKLLFFTVTPKHLSFCSQPLILPYKQWFSLFHPCFTDLSLPKYFENLHRITPDLFSYYTFLIDWKVISKPQSKCLNAFSVDFNSKRKTFIVRTFSPKTRTTIGMVNNKGT